jgi:hypothetical protein
VGGLHLDDDSSFDENVDAVKANLSATKKDLDGPIRVHPGNPRHRPAPSIT